ncbi:MAG: chemotaxis protein CheW [Spirochaetes bacterium]|nr:chemotaxis protein CheW [Spirochaetota bacterium]
MTFSLGEYQDVFLEEADDQLQELNSNLLQMEQDPDNDDIINNIFRAAHSLKSSAAFVGLNDLSDLSHKMENLLQGVRDKTMKITPEIINVLFKCFDHINGIIGKVSQGEKPDDDLSSIIAEVVRISSSASASEPVESKSSEPAAGKETKNKNIDVPKTTFESDERKHLKKAVDSGMNCYELSVFIDEDAQMKWVKAQLMLNSLKGSGEVIKTIPPENMLTDENINQCIKFVVASNETIEEVAKDCDVDLVYRIEGSQITLDKKDGKYILTYHAKEVLADYTDNHKDEKADKPEPSVPEIQQSVPQKQPDKIENEDDETDKKDISAASLRKAPTLRTVKVSVDKLDELLNNVGELVIANSGFFRLYEDLKKINADKTIINEFKNRMEQMSRIAKDLQSGIMKTRMVPIGQVFSRFNRLVRDLAKDSGKSVQLITRGEDTELDKKVVDVIGEPLMHMIRNSIDHGIELPAEREKFKKDETATVTLSAHQGGNQIYVEVSDDGKGLNADRIRKKALERNLVLPEIIANMDDSDIYEFIFHPGFSTAEKVTDVSGRGVGMNVVKEVVTEMNGSITIESEPGMGTRFIMAFPLTLAIIPAIMVKVQKETYAIPLSDVIETIKISAKDVTTIEGHEVINLRSEILSLLRLDRFVGIDADIIDDTKIPVVVVGYGNRKIGLIVDRLEGKLEIVIKPLDQNYKNIEGLAGASILGDGSISLILDISSMMTRVISEQEKLSREDRRSVLAKSSTDFETISQKPVKENIPSASTDTVRTNAGKPVISEINIPEGVLPDGKKNIFDKETTPVAKAGISNEEVDTQVKEVLRNFRNELHESVAKTLNSGDSDSHMKKDIAITDDQLRKIQILANVGIMKGAESLSSMIGRRVDLAIPEVKMMPIDSLPAKLGQIDEIYVGVYMPLEGDMRGTILFSIPEDSGFSLIDDLFAFGKGHTKEFNDDAKSSLSEVTNIVGSSVLNAFAERTGLTITPDVPTFVHDYMQSIVDSILVLHNVENDYALVMDTEFYYEDDRVMGNLLILPEAKSVKYLVEHIKE